MIVRNVPTRQQKPKSAPNAFTEVSLLLKKLMDPGAEAQEPEIQSAILTLLIPPGQEDMTPEAAKAVLEIRLSQADLDRMHELAIKNQDDALTPFDKEELKGYIRVAPLLDFLHAKALNLLAKRNQ